MSKGRLEAFSDGVFAIIITIMVLELKAPENERPEGLLPLVGVFASYVLSFVYVGIYWNNHHHLLQAARHVNGRILWANLHLLFWLSLVPFVTSWMGATSFAPWPVAAYGVVMLLAAVAYTILSNSLIREHGSDATLTQAIGSDTKGKLSLACYTAAIPLAFVSREVACGLYVLVAIMWLIPDQRIEKRLQGEEATK